MKKLAVLTLCLFLLPASVARTDESIKAFIGLFTHCAGLYDVAASSPESKFTQDTEQMAQMADGAETVIAFFAYGQSKNSSKEAWNTAWLYAKAQRSMSFTYWRAALEAQQFDLMQRELNGCQTLAEYQEERVSKMLAIGQAFQ